MPRAFAIELLTRDPYPTNGYTLFGQTKCCWHITSTSWTSEPLCQEGTSSTRPLPPPHLSRTGPDVFPRLRVDSFRPGCIDIAGVHWVGPKIPFSFESCPHCKRDFFGQSRRML